MEIDAPRPMSDSLSASFPTTPKTVARCEECRDRLTSFCNPRICVQHRLRERGEADDADLHHRRASAHIHWLSPDGERLTYPEFVASGYARAGHHRVCETCSSSVYGVLPNRQRDYM